MDALWRGRGSSLRQPGFRTDRLRVCLNSLRLIWMRRPVQLRAAFGLVGVCVCVGELRVRNSTGLGLQVIYLRFSGETSLWLRGSFLIPV